MMHWTTSSLEFRREPKDRESKGTLARLTGVLSTLVSRRNYRLIVVFGHIFVHLIDTNYFPLEGENERIPAARTRCRQNLKFDKSSSFGRLRSKNVLKCVLHVQHDYFSSFSQSS